MFLGTVLTVTDLPRIGDDGFLSSRKARIRVDESFGGLSAEEGEVDVLTGLSGGDCGVPFKPGEVYLVEASFGKDGLVHAGICSATQRFDTAGVALRILRARRDGQPVPSLAGQIAQHDRNFAGALGMHAPKPLPNALVRVKAGGRVYETRANTQGLYEFYDLQSGEYRFAPDLSPSTTLSWYIGSDAPAPSFEVKAGGCQERDIEVFASGSIQGHIFDASNQLLPHAFVYVVPAGEKVLPKERQLYWESQGKESYFKFVHIPSGEYLILVNPDDRQNPEFPYRRTFYPGVHDRASAEIITVHEGEQIKDVDFRLEPQFVPRHLIVRVAWADGRLVRKSFVHVVASATANPAAVAHTIQPRTGAGVFHLSVVPNESYEIEAELICRYADERSSGPGATLKSNAIFFAPEDNRTELLLKIPATACPTIPGKTLETL